MSHKIIVVGDTTGHGGKVISGSSVHTVDGIPIARLGDQVDCPQHYPGGKPHGVSKIVTAHPTVKAGGVPVAVEGCETECGCKLIGSKRASAQYGHGNQVISARSGTTVMSVAAALHDDMTYCPKCKGNFAIKPDGAGARHEGKPYAYDGDVTECGAKLIASL